MLADETRETPKILSVQDKRTAAGWLSLFREGNAPISLMIAGGVAIHALSMRVVSTALPIVVTKIGGLRFFAWTTTVAVITAIWGAAFAASLVRFRGLRDAYRISLALFAGGSVICATSPSMEVFLVGRLLQGLGGGFLTALAYATIWRVFRENQRTRAIVLMSGIFGAAAFTGPLVGGVLAGWGIWRWAFWIDVPFAVAVWLLAESALSNRTEPEANGAGISVRAACARLGLLTGSALAVSVGSISGGAKSSGIGLALGAALLFLLLRIERVGGVGTNPFRLLPSGAYRPGNALGAVSLTMALIAGTTNAATLYIPFVVTEVSGYPPIVGGYLSALMALCWTSAAFFTASAEGVWAERSVVFGPICVCIGLTLATYALICGSLFLLACGIGLSGAGVGIAWAHLGNLMMTHAKETEHDVSSAFISTNQLIAIAFFSALAGMIANLAGFTNVSLGGAGVITSVLSLFFCLSLISATSIPISIVSVRLSTIERPKRRQPVIS
jgi:MFS family permease